MNYSADIVVVMLHSAFSRCSVTASLAVGQSTTWQFIEATKEIFYGDRGRGEERLEEWAGASSDYRAREIAKRFVKFVLDLADLEGV